MTTTGTKPVTIITGFLGAGKTTFLNALIAYKKGQKLAVIENEYGQEGIMANWLLALMTICLSLITAACAVPSMMIFIRF